MIPTAITIGEKFTHFISDHHKFIKNDNIDERTVLNSTNYSVYPCDCYVLKCSEEVFVTMKYDQIDSFYSDDGDEQ